MYNVGTSKIYLIIFKPAMLWALLVFWFTWIGKGTQLKFLSLDIQKNERKYSILLEIDLS